MACNCRQSYCPECMEGYVHIPLVEGSYADINNKAFTWVVDTFKGLPREDCVIELPNGWGYFCVKYYPLSGIDYFRADKLKEPPLTTK